MQTQKQYDAFLSLNSEDRAAVETIARWLEDKAHLKIWLYTWNMIPGEPLQESMEEALDRSRCCVVFIGPNGIGPWQNEEMRTALAKRAEEKPFRVVPVILPGAHRLQKESELPGFLRRLAWIDFRNVKDEEALHRLRCGILGILPGRPSKQNESPLATVHPSLPAYTTANIESGEDATPLRQIGEEIGQALLPGEVRLRFEASLRSAIEAGEGLRIRLRFRDKELSAIPWEAARLDEDYLALRPATPVVCYVPASEPPRQLSIRGPVHVLGIISSPLDQAPLAVDEEKARLEQALEPLIKSGRLRLTWLETATTSALQEALRRSVHVVHYIGHGDYDAENQEGELLFEDESSATSSVKASWLATLLRDRGVRLAFLNAARPAMSQTAWQKCWCVGRFPRL